MSSHGGDIKCKGSLNDTITRGSIWGESRDTNNNRTVALRMQLCIVNGIFRVMGVATHTANIEMIIFLFVFSSDKNKSSALA